jgi:hypothetical protein
MNNNIKIFIPSYNRAETIKTSLYLDEKNIDYRIILHTENCKNEYLKAGRVKEEKIIVSNQPPGITNQRNFIMNSLTQKGEWFITLDDNISGFKRVIDQYYFTREELDVEDEEITQETYSQKVEADELLRLIEGDIKKCESIGSFYGGFASVENYFFNSKKYRYVGYIISKAAYIKNDGFGYDKRLNAMEDFGFTGDNLFRYGRVLINSWIKPINKHYEEGGIGTYERRLPSKIKDCKTLMKKYPGLYRYKIKKGCHPEAELQIRFTNLKQVSEWRNDLIKKIKQKRYE